MEAAAGLPDHLKGEFFQAIEEMQMRDQVKLYNRLAEGCFNECVTVFHGKNLTGEEERCINTCTAKFLNMSKRVGQRFAEVQMQQQQEFAQQQQ
mmetsp:Transcript_11603/g.18878  ORF Transcript_11603/g.18878 Transcript_11603/m.18878 type:complete len:94 (+) Transcript_11603:144-425(+)|eukprot:CAMPEP_0203770020 /NCGR_PEP_ID=MMETSP0099_2-20121227/2543_1 /ASSEMBLY_ACC=CAM_ASM_000209 /TAXON_ID=96639 /ORGANISM=" , Strain NY0313808BC1" /LENGTH=93 /DNA_ID=CAMNT_0050667039 /DNA_START=28 /DNA_END=309 /DNA_ORIENTATION=+